MERQRRARGRAHDGGSASPLVLALFVLASLVIVAVGRVASLSIDQARAHTAAEAMALAAVLDADLDALALAHGVSSYEIARDEHSVTVHVVRRGRGSSASAADHRRTLDVGQ
jgi:Tfp pilus assembly protein PilX